MADRHTYGLIVAFLGVALLFGGLTAGYQAATQQHTVQDEALTVDYTQESAVTEPAYTDTVDYNASVTVTANGSTLEPGTDYAWNASAGNVTWYNSTNTDSGDTAYIDYAYDAPDEGTENANDILSIFEPVLGVLLLPLAVWTALEYSGGGW